MSLTLGEKLRQAREERGFTLSEVADQTRISGLYLESIENDDYRTLPGGIFNKGFVKSYAKFVGINEQEALTDYSEIISQSDIVENPELKLYKPEVLTDNNSGSSNAPTIIIAVVILGLMSVGVWLLVNYLRPSDDPVASNSPARNTANTNSESPGTANDASSNLPTMATLKVEFKALSEPVSLSATSDGKSSSNVIPPGSTAVFEPKESLKLSYSKSLAPAVQLTLNGKVISLPTGPLVPRRNTIEFEINRDNLAQIWTSGAISTEVPSAATIVANGNTNTASVPAVTTPAAAAPTATKLPANAPANRSAINTNSAPRPTTARPATTPAGTPARPAANDNL